MPRPLSPGLRRPKLVDTRGAVRGGGGEEGVCVPFTVKHTTRWDPCEY